MTPCGSIYSPTKAEKLEWFQGPGTPAGALLDTFLKAAAFVRTPEGTVTK